MPVRPRAAEVDRESGKAGAGRPASELSSWRISFSVERWEAGEPVRPPWRDLEARRCSPQVHGLSIRNYCAPDRARRRLDMQSPACLLFMQVITCIWDMAERP